MTGRWRDQPMVGFDTETTAADPEQARIVTACVGVASRAHGWQPKNWLLHQSEPIPAEATAIHKITTEHANTHCVPAHAAIGEIRNAIYAAWRRGLPVCGHNIVYDLTVLDRELRRHGPDGLEIRGPVIDTLVVDKAVDKYRKGARTLTAMTAHYGVDLSAADAHGAEPDALASVRLAWKLGGAPVSRIGSGRMMTREPGALLTDVPLNRLTYWQTEEYAAQRRSFARYRERKGDPLEDTSTDWPLRAYSGAMTADKSGDKPTTETTKTTKTETTETEATTGATTVTVDNTNPDPGKRKDTTDGGDDTKGQGTAN